MMFTVNISIDSLINQASEEATNVNEKASHSRIDLVANHHLFPGSLSGHIGISYLQSYLCEETQKHVCCSPLFDKPQGTNSGITTTACQMLVTWCNDC